MSDGAELGPTGGALWSRPDEWERRKRPDGCIICRSGGPLDIVAELPSGWATAPTTAPLPGYVCVVARQHVNEPFELSPDDHAQFWIDSMLVASAVASVVEPIKMNYEVHGNTLPHLHMHLFPRHRDDPFCRRTDRPANVDGQTLRLCDRNTRPGDPATVWPVARPQSRARTTPCSPARTRQIGM
jgi:diadenosine tetraphosphate (Ap4A) HIT family hydrolase